MGRTENIFDTGTTLIIGDPARIKSFYLPLRSYGAQLALVQNGISIYTSTSPASAVIQADATTFDLSITIPCNFNTSIAVSVGGKEVEISPESFNLGPESEGSDTCVAGAASDESLTGSKLASDVLP